MTCTCPTHLQTARRVARAKSQLERAQIAATILAAERALATRAAYIARLESTPPEDLPLADRLALAGYRANRAVESLFGALQS